MKASTTALATLLALTGLSFGRLEEVTDFGSNPTGLKMFVELPLSIVNAQKDDNVSGKSIIVHVSTLKYYQPHPPTNTTQQLHSCYSDAFRASTEVNLPELGDSLDFILIYPESTRNSNCWDVGSAASLTHNGGGDAGGIISMINHTVTTYAADKTKIFILGSSEGGSMTNVMAGSYPDVFAAAVAYRGAGFACYAGSAGTDPKPMNTNQTCAEGIKHTPAQWGAFVRNAYPGYAGARPRMMIVNDVEDTLVRAQAGYETLMQWAEVLGVTNTANETGNAVEQGPEFTKMIYGTENKLVGYFGTLEAGNQVKVAVPAVLKFFGLQ
jgi:acetylxylan esterase